MGSRSLSLLFVTCLVVPSFAAGEAKYDMSGKWQSSRGPLTMQQGGNDLTGKSVLSNGQMAQFQGKLDGDKISFTWSIGDKQVGSGDLKTTDNGNHWAGPYTDTAKGATSTFTLSRPTAPKTTTPKSPLIDITGHWDADKGSFDFVQIENNVTGDWKVIPGLTVQIKGAMNKYQFTFTIEIDDTEVGQGTLQLSSNQQNMQGSAELQGRSYVLNLKRDNKR